jgi:hypothetical protein
LLGHQINIISVESKYDVSQVGFDLASREDKGALLLKAVETALTLFKLWDKFHNFVEFLESRIGTQCAPCEVSGNLTQKKSTARTNNVSLTRKIG